MLTLDRFPSQQLPDYLKYQILGYVRVQWWQAFEGGRRFWDFFTKETMPVHFVLHEQKMVISHAEVTQREVEFEGCLLQIYGVSAVFTFPSFRGEGCATQVVKAATEYILTSDADVAMLFCGSQLRPFYTQLGWIPLPHHSVLFGEPAAPQIDEEDEVLMLFVSDRGRDMRHLFESQPPYVGASLW